MAPHPGLPWFTYIWVPALFAVVTNGVSDIATQCIERHADIGRQGTKSRRRRRRAVELRSRRETRSREEAEAPSPRGAAGAAGAAGVRFDLPAEGGGGDARGSPYGDGEWGDDDSTDDDGDDAAGCLPLTELDCGRLARFSFTPLLTLAGTRWQLWCVALEKMMPGTSLWSATRKTLLTELTWDPFWTAASIAVPVWLEYGDCAVVRSKVRQEWAPAFFVGLAFYVPLEFAMFAWQPGTSMMNTYVWVLVDPVYACYMSFLTARDLRHAGRYKAAAPADGRATPMYMYRRGPSATPRPGSGEGGAREEEGAGGAAEEWVDAAADHGDIDTS